MWPPALPPPAPSLPRHALIRALAQPTALATTTTVSHYHGLVALLVRRDNEPEHDAVRIRAALDHMLHSNAPNPIMSQVLSCYERELARNPADVFNREAGGGGVPIMVWDDQELHPGVDGDAAMADAAGATAGVLPDAANPNGTRRLQPNCGIQGALQTPFETRPNAVDAAHGITNLTVGNTVTRTGDVIHQPAQGTTSNTSVENLQHTTLHHRGEGGWWKKPDNTQCEPHHHSKLRIFSVVNKFRHSTEFVWGKYQSLLKASLHNSSTRLVNPVLAQTATQADLAEQRAALLRANPGYDEHLRPEETFSGGVPKTIRGGKRYWREAFLQLMAMAAEYGTPQFFLTLTENERGWRDLRTATGGAYHGDRPVEATRQYHRRWASFKKIFLTGDTPIGTITHLWYRHEDQVRGSLHIHMAIWVHKDTAKPEAICGPAPRQCSTPAELEWRRFVLGVQYHGCRNKCHFKRGEFQGNDFCKSGYPRPLLDEYDDSGTAIPIQLCTESDRYIYRTTHAEDQRLSPYVPLWLLGWGANMNIQYCTTAGFLSYISKYVAKSEPTGQVPDTSALREREGCSGQVRFLVARKVGAPEVVFTLGQWPLKEGARVEHLETRPPNRRRRALACRQQEGTVLDADEPLRFCDGQIEQYQKRPHARAAVLAGAAVRIVRGAYAQRLARTGVVVKWQPSTSRWIVRIAAQRRHPEAELEVAEGDLELLEGLHVGHRARLHDLPYDQRLQEGNYVTLLDYNTATCEWEVQCDQRQVRLHVRERQLTKLYINFDELTYPDFHRNFKVSTYAKVSARVKAAGSYWPLYESVAPTAATEAAAAVVAAATVEATTAAAATAATVTAATEPTAAAAAAAVAAVAAANAAAVAAVAATAAAAAVAATAATAGATAGVAAADPQPHARYVSLRKGPKPVWWDWLLPTRHHNRFYYQLLLLRVPFRDCTPRRFLSSPAENIRQSLQEECSLRRLLEGGGEASHVEAEATRRNFTPDQVRSMVEESTLDDYLEFMQVRRATPPAAWSSCHTVKLRVSPLLTQPPCAQVAKSSCSPAITQTAIALTLDLGTLATAYQPPCTSLPHH